MPNDISRREIFRHFGYAAGVAGGIAASAAASVPSTAEITVTEQPNRPVVHLLHYAAARRAPELDIVKDLIPLFNVPLSLRAEKRPKQAYLVPQRKDLQLNYDAGYARVVVPVVEGHQMVVFEN